MMLYLIAGRDRDDVLIMEEAILGAGGSNSGNGGGGDGGGIRGGRGWVVCR
jgi:hypothetical protein